MLLVSIPLIMSTFIVCCVVKHNKDQSIFKGNLLQIISSFRCLTNKRCNLHFNDQLISSNYVMTVCAFNSCMIQRSLVDTEISFSGNFNVFKSILLFFKINLRSANVLQQRQLKSTMKIPLMVTQTLTKQVWLLFIFTIHEPGHVQQGYCINSWLLQTMFTETSVLRISFVS